MDRRSFFRQGLERSPGARGLDRSVRRDSRPVSLITNNHKEEEK